MLMDMETKIIRAIGDGGRCTEVSNVTREKENTIAKEKV